MSQAYLAYLTKLYDSTEHSDCTITFVLGNDGPPASKRPRTRKSCAPSQTDSSRTKIATLPAHLMVLCGGSERFTVLAKEWRREHDPETRPDLHVVLSTPEDVLPARTAIRFMYTGSAEPMTASEALQVRRLAATLQVRGCAEACDQVLLDLVSTSVKGVGKLYACRHLLPDRAEGGITTELLHACGRQLVKWLSWFPLTPGTLPGAFSLGELLAWSFGDAPSLLCDPDAKQQMLKLPAAGMEALLGSDSFGTDDEASVLLMLASWLDANPSTDTETRRKLCSLIRLCHMNAAYLHGLLPKISWFPISREEHQFLCQYIATRDTRSRTLLTIAAAGKHDCTTAWYVAPRRPHGRVDAGWEYEWSIKQGDLEADLDMGLKTVSSGLDGTFSNGLARLVTQGFEVFPGTIWLKNGKAEAVLSCAVPGPFSRFATVQDVVGVTSTTAKLAVFRWRGNGEREEAPSRKYGSNDAISVTCGHPGGAWRVTLFGSELQKGPGAAARLLPKLAPYLHEGKLTGSLTFL